MLTAEENELLTRTNAGTPMGELFRRFWLPALLPSELPVPDSDPIRFRMLGEDLIAFRDTTGQVGFLANACPHRGASLFFGRNEECGLRCVYHGWKFDVTGACVDMPNEPAESSFKQKIKATAYPAVERGGFIWIYMGPSAEQPAFPNYQWLNQPDASSYVASKWLQESNYTQGLEGNIDSAHVGILHRTLAHPVFTTGNLQSAQDVTVAKETEFGFVYGARRPQPDDSYYWRVTTFTMPTFTQIASQSRAGGGLFVLPQDDENSWWFTINPPRPPAGAPGARDADFGALLSGTSIADPATLGLIPGTFKRVRNKSNDYLIDRQMQRTFNYTGLPGNRPQDQAVTESMGPVYDRRKEHLGTSDTAIILMRRYLMRLARELEAGQRLAMLTFPDRFRTIPMAVNSPEGDFNTLWDTHYDAFARELNLTLR